MSDKNEKILQVIAKCNDLSKHIKAVKLILDNPSLNIQVYETLVVYTEHYDATDTEGKLIRLKAKRFLTKELRLIVVA